MLSLFVILLSLNAVAGAYSDNEKTEEKNDWKKSEEKSVEEESEVELPGPEYYDEVYAVGYNGEVKASAALYGTGDWHDWKLNGGELYQPAGVAICNGKVDEWGRWAYLYVADAGDAEHPGAVYQYNINRVADTKGEVQISNRKLVYGGAERKGMPEVKDVSTETTETETESVAEAESDVDAVAAHHKVDPKAPAAPVDVLCDPSSKGIFIADNNWGQVEWNPKHNANANEDWVGGEDCGDAVHGVQAVAKDGKWLYWSTANNDNKEASGVYRNDVTNKAVDCKKAKEDDKWLKDGGAVEKVAKHEDGGWGVAIHKDQVLVAQDDAIYSVGKVGEAHEPEQWSWDHQKVRKVASAHDRGVVYADEGANAVYVTKGKAKHNKVADVQAAYGVDYYAGEDGWKGAEDDDDSATSVFIASVAALVAVAAMF